MRRRDAILLGWPDLEDGVVVGELVQVEPLHRYAEVVHDEGAQGAAVERTSRAWVVWADIAVGKPLLLAMAPSIPKDTPEAFSIVEDAPAAASKVCSGVENAPIAAPKT